MTEKRDVYGLDLSPLLHTLICTPGASGQLVFGCCFWPELFGRPARWKRLITGTSLFYPPEKTSHSRQQEAKNAPRGADSERIRASGPKPTLTRALSSPWVSCFPGAHYFEGAPPLRNPAPHMTSPAPHMTAAHLGSRAPQGWSRAPQGGEPGSAGQVVE